MFEWSNFDLEIGPYKSPADAPLASELTILQHHQMIFD